MTEQKHPNQMERDELVETVLALRAQLAEHVDRGPEVAGAIAKFIRATPPSDPGFRKLMQAYGVALVAAGLAPSFEPTHDVMDGGEFDPPAADT